MGLCSRSAAFTGLRLGELRGLRWVDVDWARRLVHVRRSFTRGEAGLPKSGKVRSVPLVDQAARALDELSRRERFTEDDDLVFVNNLGQPFEESAMRQRFYAALDAAGLARIRLHDLRHTFGTLAVQAFPLTDVKAYMGHADIQTTMIYVIMCPSTTQRIGSPACSRRALLTMLGARRVRGRVLRVRGRRRIGAIRAPE